MCTKDLMDVMSENNMRKLNDIRELVKIWGISILRSSNCKYKDTNTVKRLEYFVKTIRRTVLTIIRGIWGDIEHFRP